MTVELLVANHPARGRTHPIQKEITKKEAERYNSFEGPAYQPPGMAKFYDPPLSYAFFLFFFN
jgi:hypothetical protein